MARAAGLDFFVSTDHDTSSASLQWGDYAGDDLLIVNGEEVTTRSGHWPAWGLPAGKWIDWRYRADDQRDFRRFVDDVHDAGEHADVVEVWNGPWTLDDEAAVIAWDGLAVGNSDAHNPDQVVALPHNVVLADGLRPRRLLDGFRAGHNWLAESSAVSLSYTATDGARTVGIGDRLRSGTGTEVTFEVAVSGMPGTSVRLLNQIGPQWSEQVDASGTAAVRWQTQSRYSIWVRAEVRRPVPTATTPDTMVALTNPIFLG